MARVSYFPSDLVSSPVAFSLASSAATCMTASWSSSIDRILRISVDLDMLREAAILKLEVSSGAGRFIGRLQVGTACQEAVLRGLVHDPVAMRS